ncbi:hypothetical protein E2C01_013308 [Portunus trituberculatus]|uniref:Uncharacterized protein n=1 Tax=Portunus trituberculatus TaxID=210409 RepID=A0A5B7DGX8_PORTR|nr:hypothetical protein [Portunus trituberculatus]
MEDAMFWVSLSGEICAIGGVQWVGMFVVVEVVVVVVVLYIQPADVTVGWYEYNLWPCDEETGDLPGVWRDGEEEEGRTSRQFINLMCKITLLLVMVMAVLGVGEYKAQVSSRDTGEGAPDVLASLKRNFSIFFGLL